jgi:hypothetical protein
VILPTTGYQPVPTGQAERNEARRNEDAASRRVVREHGRLQPTQAEVAGQSAEPFDCR